MSNCTPFPEELHCVGHLILCNSDFRIWEAPVEDYKGPMEYIEATGELNCNGIICPRVWDHIE